MSQCLVMLLLNTIGFLDAIEVSVWERIMGDLKVCPLCGEEIKLIAIKCKHCGSMFGVKNEDEYSNPQYSESSGRSSYLFALWIIGTILIILSWFDEIDPVFGWIGFFISLVAATLSWSRR